MRPKLTEYQVTYATKEYLLSKGWDVIAYNPPGSQGTFTIPNPSKDSGFRGQTGSESPDIIAVHGEIILIVEAKPRVNLEDVNKLLSLKRNLEKLDILQVLVRKVCEANGIDLPNSVKLLWATATGDAETNNDWLGHFRIDILKPMNVSRLKAQSNYYDYFECLVVPAKEWTEDEKAIF